MALDYAGAGHSSLSVKRFSLRWDGRVTCDHGAPHRVGADGRRVRKGDFLPAAFSSESCPDSFRWWGWPVFDCQNGEVCGEMRKGPEAGPFLCNLDLILLIMLWGPSGPSRLACTRACRRGGPSYRSGIRAWPPSYS